jgi:hypothetical protein
MTTNETETRTVWNLARMADCADPDTAGSAGADFLQHVRIDTAEAIRDGRHHEDDPHDLAHEIADQCVPIATYTVWATFVDLAAWQEDLDELGGSSGDMEQDAKVSLYMIAQRLASALLEEAAEADDDDDDDA